MAIRSTRNIVSGIAFALLLAVGVAHAQSPGFGGSQPQAPAQPDAGWTKFTEPTEHAYTVDVPQGWKAAGGVKRFAPSEAPVWFTAQSPDGQTELFLGDPAISTFSLPNQFAQEGSQMPGPHRPQPVMRYRPGAEFAAMYGSRSLPQACANVRLQGTHPLPQVEDEMRQHVASATRLDAGGATFTCDRNGQPMAAGVDAGTVELLFPGANGAGFWVVVALRGYVTPAAQAQQTVQILDHIVNSFVPDPQFVAAIQQASAQEEQSARQQSQQAPAPAPAPTQYSPAPSYRPLPTASACPGDLQQQRICTINDGHLVVENGCLRCLAP